MSTDIKKQTKRTTKLVRISDKWHFELKKRSGLLGKTISKLTDVVFEDYFDNGQK